jgi:hypothetical protein
VARASTRLLRIAIVHVPRESAGSNGKIRGIIAMTARAMGVRPTWLATLSTAVNM